MRRNNPEAFRKITQYLWPGMAGDLVEDNRNVPQKWGELEVNWREPSVNLKEWMVAGFLEAHSGNPLPENPFSELKMKEWFNRRVDIIESRDRTRFPFALGYIETSRATRRGVEASKKLWFIHPVDGANEATIDDVNRWADIFRMELRNRDEIRNQNLIPADETWEAAGASGRNALARWKLTELTGAEYGSAIRGQQSEALMKASLQEQARKLNYDLEERGKGNLLRWKVFWESQGEDNMTWGEQISMGLVVVPAQETIQYGEFIGSAIEEKSLYEQRTANGPFTGRRRPEPGWFEG